MEIFIKDLNGRLQTYSNVPPNCPVQQLKEEVLKRLADQRLQLTDIRLMYLGKNLENNRTLQSYNIATETMLYAMYRVIGGY